MKCHVCGAEGSAIGISNAPKRYGYFDKRNHICNKCAQNNIDTQIVTFEIPAPIGIKNGNVLIRRQFNDCPVYFEIYNGYRLAEKLQELLKLSEEETLYVVNLVSSLCLKVPKSNKAISLTLFLIIVTKALVSLRYPDSRTFSKHFEIDYKINKCFPYNEKESASYKFFDYYYKQIDKNAPALKNLKFKTKNDLYALIMTNKAIFFSKQEAENSGEA